MSNFQLKVLRPGDCGNENASGYLIIDVENHYNFARAPKWPCELRRARSVRISKLATDEFRWELRRIMRSQ